MKDFVSFSVVESLCFFLFIPKYTERRSCRLLEYSELDSDPGPGQKRMFEESVQYVPPFRTLGVNLVGIASHRPEI